MFLSEDGTWCPSCGRWFVGAQARILREIIQAARIR